MSEPLLFNTRDTFREWLTKNAETSDGVWLTFGKTKALPTLKAGEALEEALCFGWIDGLMKRVDDQSYIKYFSQRRKDSKWSKKNKELALQLEEKGLMTDLGRRKIDEAKKNGKWASASSPSTVTEEQVAQVRQLLKANEAAYLNFTNMSPSVKRTYTRAYFDAKTESGRTKRLAWMLERLEQNLKPM
ncbi:YdeI/OmpD-associated family protein [Enterococcus sp. LJL128]|uniref:YdeI/OmpD-associated family protein n=1 Tax=Enterococcus sp. LJL51 TaxID=3416656 RepID=UPI003CE9D7F9